MKNPEFQIELAHFYGTEHHFKNPLYGWMVYTDGVQYFAEHAGNGAYWFLDIIGSEFQALWEKHPFLSITLKTHNGGARITATDGNDRRLYQRVIGYTDCPEGEYNFYLTDATLLLASEY